MPAAQHDRALLAAGHHGDAGMFGQLRHRRIDIVGLVQRLHLILVAEHDVHMAFQQAAEIGAMALHAEYVAQREGHLVARLARHLDRGLHGRPRRRRIPQIAFQIENARFRHQFGIQIAGIQFLAGAQIGVHRALAIGRHHDQAAPGRRAARGRRRIKRHARRADIVGEHLPQLIARHPAHKRRARAQRRCTHHRIGRRTTADLAPGAHRTIKRLGLGGIDQPHAAMLDPTAGQEIRGLAADHINDGVAHGENVILRHARLLKMQAVP